MHDELAQSGIGDIEADRSEAYGENLDDDCRQDGAVPMPPVQAFGGTTMMVSPEGADVVPFTKTAAEYYEASARLPDGGIIWACVHRKREGWQWRTAGSATEATCGTEALLAAARWVLTQLADAAPAPGPSEPGS